jgi:hypothetical protein
MTEQRPEDSDLVREEEQAAASAAGRIGGTAGDENDFDPAMRPVYEAGGGVAEGFEQAEADLVENAQHGDGHGDPAADAFRPEAESDLSGATYGEGDEEKVTEVVRDPDDPRGEDDPGQGPKLTSER